MCDYFISYILLYFFIYSSFLHSGTICTKTRELEDNAIARAYLVLIASFTKIKCSNFLGSDYVLILYVIHIRCSTTLHLSTPFGLVNFWYKTNKSIINVFCITQ